MPYTARIEAGLTREVAANLADCGTRMLADYESGKVTAPARVALNITKNYPGQQDFSAKHCANKCPIGQEFCYNIKKKPVANAALQTVRAYKDLKAEYIYELIKIAEDGEIIPAEQEKAEQITLLLMNFEKAIEEWKLSVADKVDIPALTKMVDNEKQTQPASKRSVR